MLRAEIPTYRKRFGNRCAKRDKRKARPPQLSPLPHRAVHRLILRFAQVLELPPQLPSFGIGECGLDQALGEELDLAIGCGVKLSLFPLA